MLSTSAVISSRPALGFVLNDVARLLRNRFEQRPHGLGSPVGEWRRVAHG